MKIIADKMGVDILKLLRQQIQSHMVLGDFGLVQELEVIVYQ